MNPWLQRAIDLLAPRIGRVTATNSVTLALRKMGAASDSVGREHMPEIARNVSTILRVFLGSDAAAQLEEELATLEVEE